MGTYDKLWEIVLLFTREIRVTSKYLFQVPLDIIFHYFLIFEKEEDILVKNIKFGPEVPEFMC